MDDPCEPNPPREVDELCELPEVDLPDDVPDELEPDPKYRYGWYQG